MVHLAGTVVGGLTAMALLWPQGTVTGWQDGAADVHLVLLVDVSESVNARELQVERDGYVAAFRDPDLWSAIEQGAHGAIRVAYVEWSSEESQRLVLPVTRIAGAADALVFAATLEAEPVIMGQSTSMSGALAFAGAVLAGMPREGARRVIDLSSDGINNAGPLVTAIRDVLVAEGVTVNGLPMAIGPGGADGFSGYGREGYLERYFETCVIGGAGAFVMAVNDPDRIGASILHKLVHEIAGSAPPERVIRAEAVLPLEDCATPGSLPWR